LRLRISRARRTRSRASILCR